MAPHSSAIPTFYYTIFAIFEPLLCVVSMLGTFANPKAAHDSQTIWPLGPPTDPLPHATLITIIQLAHVCGLMGLVNSFILTAARKHLAPFPDLQEKIVRAALAPLLIGDVSHLCVTFWALGEHRWAPSHWGNMTWTVLGLGLALLIPRLCWYLGFGRFVSLRDGLKPQNQKDTSASTTSEKLKN